MHIKSKKNKRILLTASFGGLLILGSVYFLFLNGCASSRLPGDAELTIVHLTDIHLSTNGTVRETPWTHKIILGGYKLHKPCTGKSFELFENAVSVIKEKINPDIVVITGDFITNGNDVEALKKGAEIIRRLNCPVIIAKGDHDISGKDENKLAWESVLGNLDGSVDVKGASFFFVPYESDEGTFRRLEKGINDPQKKNKTNFLCMHRMLYSSWLMNRLSKKYCSTLLSPDREKIINILEKTSGHWVVLCGHSHTNHEETVNNITELCTSSLAEYPHEFRIVKIKSGKVYTKIVKLDEMKTE